ncbi:hypothetical protein MRS44_002827 [Fusarium solani]|uniref:uncharacterized protein n=1 Tax=Fusarium solani TaxID=169388 RepID=UPI0032C4AF76|nr:hypothetical protein MRS44_002827 [Fusarium solani]
MPPSCPKELRSLALNPGGNLKRALGRDPTGPGKCPQTPRHSAHSSRPTVAHYSTQEAPKRAKSVATTVAEPLPALELQQISRHLQGAVPKFPLCAGQSCQQRDFSRSPPSALSPISAPYPARRRKCSRQAWTMNQRAVEAVAHRIPDYPTMAPWDGPWMAMELQEG